MTQQPVKLEDIPLGELEWTGNTGSDYFTQVLKENGCEIAFGIHGGDLWALVDAWSRAGIRLITFHHEQAAVYAAEAYAKVTGKPGVTYADLGPGTANQASALQQAYTACSPIVTIVGGIFHGHEGEKYTFQPSIAEKLYQGITKWVLRITEPSQIKYAVTKAFRDSQIYPKGPCGIEFSAGMNVGPAAPGSLLMGMVQHVNYLDQWRRDNTGQPLPPVQGDPATIERAVKRIFEAKRPILLAGDGAHWSNASPELIGFIELAQIPSAGRRVGRGAVPEVNPLFWTSRIHSQVVPEADLVVLVGMKVGLNDGFGAEWSRAIQINESPDHIFTFINTDTAIVGNPKLVLKQMIDYIKANNLKPPPERAEWVKKIQDLAQASRERLQERALKYKDHKPIHHGYLCKVLWDLCERRYGGMNRVIIDGYTISGYIPPFVKARYSGQVMDAGEQAGVGHGVGMAIGAAFGDPDTRKQPIVSLLGDAGIGNSGMDIETAVRYELPIVYIVTNNNGWLSGMRTTYYGKGWEALGPQDRKHGQDFLPDIRYEKFADMFGCYGEYVNEPGQLEAALERAFTAAEGGKPAVLNVIVDPTLVNTVTMTGTVAALYQMLWAHIPYRELPKWGKKLRRYWLGQFAPLFPFDNYGIPQVEAPDAWEPVSEEDQLP